MARAAFVAGLLASFVFALSAAGEEALEGNIWGYFRPAKRPPAAFADIAELHLAGRGEYGWKASRPNYGMIRMRGKNGAIYGLKQPTIDGLRIEFTTEALRGVSYSFTGVLARGDFSTGAIPIDEVMLRGTMRRWKNGKEVAAGEMQFAFEPGG